MFKPALRCGPFAVCALLSGAVLFADAPVIPLEINQIAHDKGPNLRDIKGVGAAPGPNVDKPLRLIRPYQVKPNQPDPIVQFSPAPSVSTTPGLGFAGVGNGDYGFTPNAAPPDTTGVVGATQYVQWVNESFAVFDKTTGARIYGPVAGNTLWSGFGGGCQTNNDGDPIVQYDKIANRWIMTQFSVSTTPYLQCVAVSTTSDATGSYYRYAFQMPYFNDYPKLGVWPDGYYISFNMFNGNSFVGGRACVFDRASMLQGLPASAQCAQLSSAYGGLLPSDLDGATAPPAGAPNYFLAFGTNVLQMWKFHVDWTTPANSKFTGPTNIPVASFTEACSGGTCIPQQGTNQQLDSLGDRLMYRLAYRNFGDHESLVVNHSVSNNGVAGVRWYELRGLSGTPTVYQQSTFSPDTKHRWMGSIGMDKAGNIAVGYSVSSSTMYPSIAYTGRLVTDPINTLQAETTLLTGGGSQTGYNLSRWGDYSTISIDPVDDCTFWYTNEYLKASGAFNWSTRIFSFKFSNCGSAPPVLTSITVSPASASVQTGGTKQFSATALDQFGQPMNPQPTFTWSVSGGGTISGSGLFTAGATAGGPFTVTASSGGVNGTASVTVTAPPVLTRITVSPASASVKINGQQQFSATGYDQNGQPMSPQPTFTWTVAGGGSISASGLFTAGSTPGGPFTVTASSGTVNGTASVTVTSVPDFTISATPSSRTVSNGGNTTYSVSITAVNGFTGAVSLSLSGLPQRTSASFTPSSITGTGSSTLSVNTNRRTPAGNYTLTIRGTSGSLVHSTTVTLVVQ